NAQIDGQPVSDILTHREEDPSGFFVNWPKDNIFGYPPLPKEAGVCVTDGYWLMLSPLSSGSHDIHFAGSLPDFGFSLDVTYHLNVGGASTSTAAAAPSSFADAGIIGQTSADLTGAVSLNNLEPMLA